MTIASEITRLQNDKAAMCTAIENKGVTVGNATFDDYAACIDAIQQGGNIKGFCYLVVGGGASGSSCNKGNGGGGAGEAVCGKNFIDDASPFIAINIGAGGASVTGTGQMGNNGGASCIVYGGTTIKANGGYKSADGFTGGCSGGGYAGGTGNSGVCCGGGGGGGSRGAGGNFSGCKGGAGGLGITYCGIAFAGGGGGAGAGCTSTTAATPGAGCCGGGSGGANVAGYSSNGGAATGCGGGGGGSALCNSSSGAGGGGAVLISYPSDGSWGISNGGGGCKFIYGDYTVHCFVDGGYFVADCSKRYIKYLVVGGGGGGGGRYPQCICDRRGFGGGGGGDVRAGVEEISECSFNVVVGCGGVGGTCDSGCRGGDGGMSCFGTIISNGGCGGLLDGGNSGSGCAGGCGCPGTTWGGGGGGGARGAGGVGSSYLRGGGGGVGYLCVGGGGGGGAGGVCTGCAGAGSCGGGKGGYGYDLNGHDATSYGSGGGGGGGSPGPSSRSDSKGGAGCQGVVEVCYPIDGAFGFSCATGGDECYVCNGICIHRFTSSGTFTIVS